MLVMPVPGNNRHPACTALGTSTSVLFCPPTCAVIATDNRVISDNRDTDNMTTDHIVDSGDDTEKEILDRLTNLESEEDGKPKDQESEEAEFDKLHSMIPYLTSKSATQLDIVLEAITYINILQNKLLQNLQS